MLARLAALATLALPLVAALPKIHAKGKYLYDESGNRFYIKVCGVTRLYSQDFADDFCGLYRRV